MALNFANNNSLSAITTKPSGLSGGALNLISTQTASSSSTISFTSGIDDTYDSYVFKFYDIHGSSASPFTVNFRDGGSSYDATKTTTYFAAYNHESGSPSNLVYGSGEDLAQSTGTQQLSYNMGTANDESLSGQLFLYNPSSTTFVKHFIATTNFYQGTYSQEIFVAGYCNTTTAIDGVQFKLNSGNIDSGVIKLYGVS